ncbi:MAG: hypothetical protein JSW06_02715 [Thermoplasmatales archaeon]|nr:MAG: hypothetical protein JSW06_02715 [Thermoplasmatales archaeon]
MKIALVTLMDDNFFIAYECFWKSFIYHNPWFGWDFVVIDNGLSEESKEKIKKNYDNTYFKKINKKAYSNVRMDKTHPKLKATYYTLEAFTLTSYDRIVFMDMDITILGDVKELFACKASFAACRAYNAKQDKFTETFNSGVFVVQKDYLKESVYSSLINIAKRGFSMPDQKTLNVYFRDIKTWLPKRYNVEKRMLHTKNHKKVWDQKICVHFVSTKPWQIEKPNEVEASFKEIEDVWWKYYEM